ncbi:hypothetical protein [Burkholderia paludis]
MVIDSSEFKSARREGAQRHEVPGVLSRLALISRDGNAIKKDKLISNKF